MEDRLASQNDNSEIKQVGSLGNREMVFSFKKVCAKFSSISSYIILVSLGIFNIIVNENPADLVVMDYND